MNTSRSQLDPDMLARLASSLLQSDARDVSVHLYPLRQGLESFVARVVARRRCSNGWAPKAHFVCG
jgi:hypothetical protein